MAPAPMTGISQPMASSCFRIRAPSAACVTNIRYSGLVWRILVRMAVKSFSPETKLSSSVISMPYSSQPSLVDSKAEAPQSSLTQMTPMDLAFRYS